MLRAVLAVIACISLAGCWASEERIFRDGDWAHLSLDGRYKGVDATGDEQARVVLKARPNGLIEGTGLDFGVIGLVRIEGGSGRYFLAVDRSDESADGDIYLIARLADGGTIEFYWPDCAGTPPMEGLTVAYEDLIDATVCAFSTRAALMRAGLEAERFLSAKHIVTIQPMGKLVPVKEAGGAE
jgi:hypothetical protein